MVLQVHIRGHGLIGNRRFVGVVVVALARLGEGKQNWDFLPAQCALAGVDLSFSSEVRQQGLLGLQTALQRP